MIALVVSKIGVIFVSQCSKKAPVAGSRIQVLKKIFKTSLQGYRQLQICAIVTHF
jgi:hypothetical protein